MDTAILTGKEELAKASTNIRFELLQAQRKIGQTNRALACHNMASL